MYDAQHSCRNESLKMLHLEQPRSHQHAAHGYSRFRNFGSSYQQPIVQCAAVQSGKICHYPTIVQMWIVKTKPFLSLSDHRHVFMVINRQEIISMNSFIISNSYMCYKYIKNKHNLQKTIHKQ